MFPLIFLGLLIAGFVVIALGIRGRPVFTSPRCAKCSYDLRAIDFMTQQIGACPECGADLSTVGAVTFGRLEKRPRMIVAGSVVALSPLLLIFVMSLLARSRVIGGGTGPQASQARTTPALITSLATTLNQPWDWQELERRLGAGLLTTGDVDAVFNVLINNLSATRAAGQQQPAPHWAEAFLKLAIQRGDVNPAVLQALCQTFYGTSPRILSRNRIRQGQPMEIEIDMVRHWNLPDMELCWALQQVTADGETSLSLTSAGEDPASKVAMHPDRFTGTNRGRGSDDVRAKLTHALTPGEHEVSFTFDVGAIPAGATLRGLDGKAGTTDKWPNPITTWQTVVKQKVKVLAPDQSIVDLVTNPSQDPFQTTRFGIEQVLARPSSQGAEIVIKWTEGQYPDPPISYRVTLVADGESIDYGTIFFGRLARGSTSSRPASKTVKALPADVKTIDVLLTPDPASAERFIGVEEIWGGEHKIEGVKLERFDLEAPR